MDPVVHFELPAKDRERMAKFYSSAFGWKMDFLGEEMGSYTMVTTTAVGENGRPSEPGSINGGFYMATEDPASHCPSVVIAVQDVAQSADGIKAAGGTILRGPEEIPGVGLYVSFRDTEGNRMSLLQPSR